METLRFDRHSIFSAEDIKFHSQTIREVEDFYFAKDMSPWESGLVNELNGIWDGYLYWNILNQAQSEQLPASLIERIRSTVDLVKRELGE
jgi:hypothetical protein